MQQLNLSNLPNARCLTLTTCLADVLLGQLRCWLPVVLLKGVLDRDHWVLGTEFAVQVEHLLLRLLLGAVIGLHLHMRNGTGTIDYVSCSRRKNAEVGMP